jgi:hypothetical protein
MARKPATPTDPNDAKFRNRIARWVVGGSLVGIILISIAVLWTASDRASAARSVFGSVLPLLGTWVGTVLAFYFAKDNFEAATQSTLQLTGLLSPDTLVAKVMIPRASIIGKELKANETASSVTVGDLRALMDSSKKKRIPIFDSNGAVQWVVHDSLLLAFAATENKAIDDATVLSKTLSDILAKPPLATLAKAVAFVGVDATIATARTKLQSVAGSNDVFVTATGDGTERVVGWLTNSLLASSS